MASSTLSDASLIEALTSKKTSIKSQITELKAQFIQLSDGLSHIDATIALLNDNRIALQSMKYAVTSNQMNVRMLFLICSELHLLHWIQKQSADGWRIRQRMSSVRRIFDCFKNRF